MKGLSSLERVVLECVGKQSVSYEEILSQSGLHENVCFNVIQALIIRNILATNGIHYHVSEKLSPLIMEEINGDEAKQAESLELIEALLEQKSNRHFRFKKIAMDSKDEKIFQAMLINLESFIADAHKKSQKYIPIKDRKIVFWGTGDVKNILTQIVTGKNI